MALPGLTGMSSTLLIADTYWIGLAVTVATLATIYLLLRGRLGLVLTAIRDDEVAARSSGARVGLARLLVFVIAGTGCGVACGAWSTSTCGCGCSRSATGSGPTTTRPAGGGWGWAGPARRNPLSAAWGRMPTCC